MRQNLAHSFFIEHIAKAQNWLGSYEKTKLLISNHVKFGHVKASKLAKSKREGKSVIFQPRHDASIFETRDLVNCVPRSRNTRTLSHNFRPKLL